MYFDDLISGGPTVTKAKELKCDAVTIFSDAGFELHKWHSNAPEVEDNICHTLALLHSIGFAVIEYRQFVANRVKKTKDHEINEWRHVPSDQNPADLGSRGGSITDADLWWNGPNWL